MRTVSEAVIARHRVVEADVQYFLKTKRMQKVDPSGGAV